MVASVKRRPRLKNALKRLSALSGHGVTRRNGKTLLNGKSVCPNGKEELLWKRSLRGGALRPKRSVSGGARVGSRSARQSVRSERPQSAQQERAF